MVSNDAEGTHLVLLVGLPMKKPSPEAQPHEPQRVILEVVQALQAKPEH